MHAARKKKAAGKDIKGLILSEYFPIIIANKGVKQFPRTT